MADNINGSNLSVISKPTIPTIQEFSLALQRHPQQNFAAVGEINRLLAGKANANLPGLR